MPAAVNPSIAQLAAPDLLRQLASDGALQRGAAYARSGRVESLEQSGQRLQAEVRGSQRYRVELRAERGRLVGDCTCPVGAVGVFCKHCVAAALVAAAAADAPAQPASESGFASEAELNAFLDERGLGHVRRLGAEVLLPFVPDRERAALRYVLTRQRFTDFASAESVRRYGFALAHARTLRERVPAAALAFLEDELQALARARAQVPARVVPPEAGPARELFVQLLELRAGHEGVPPRPDEILTEERLKFSEALPGFVWVDDRPWVPPNTWVPSVPRVELTLARGAAKAACSGCQGPCLHTLAAIDAALRRFSGADVEAQRLAEELQRPAWARALDAIGRALEEAEGERGEAVVSWRLHVAPDEGVAVTPYLHKPTRKGHSAGSRVGVSALTARYGQALSPQDQRVARGVERDFGFASRATLEALAGHPRVYLEHDPQARVQVDKARVGLLADHRGDSVALCAAVDGAPLPRSYLERLRPKDDGRPLFLFEEAAARLTLLEVPAEVRRTLEALSRFGNDFPPESHGALVEKLSALSARVPVAMPRSVVGEAVPLQLRVVLRLQVLGDGAVSLELRVRPLPDAPAFLPEDGVRDVHVRREGRAVHARRDFEAEARAAAEVRDWLELGTPEEPSHPYAFRLDGAQDALELLSRLEGWTEAARPELEWVGEPVRLAGRAGPASLKVVLERRRDWFGALGGLSVAGERVNLAVLLDAARRRERFVRTESRGFLEVTEALRRHLERLSDHAWRSGHGVELGPSAVQAVDALGEDGAEISADKAWTHLAERIFAAKELTARVPSGLEATLRDYQLEGFRWLARLSSWGAGAVLADDMGLGKTIQALALLLQRAKLGPALVVAPTSVGFNWVEEGKRFAPGLKLHVYAESPDRGETLERLGPKDVLVLSYGLLAKDSARLAKVKFATVVFDEAQALKNVQTRRARAARDLQGEFKFALSGTPLENHLGELWSLFRIVFPGLLGSWDSFRDRFATPIEKKLDPTAAPALSRVLAPFLLRRTKAQVAQELPPKTELRVPVVLSPDEWQLYEDARLAALSELETPRPQLREQQRRVQVLAALTRLRLVACHPRLYDPRSKVASSKLERLLELVAELRDEGRRALVFSQFTSHLALVKEVLDARQIPYLYLDGSTPRAERQHLVRSFQEGEVPLFLVSLKAGGFGLNLTGADNVIHLDPWWNPAVEDQASDRAHRIGQHRPVTVFRLVAKGTLEEQILALHEDKRALVGAVLEGKDEAARLSTRELLALLSRPAARLDALEPPTPTRH